MSVIFLSEVREYLRELEEILYAQEYFGFEDQAFEYVKELIVEIENHLHYRLRKPAPAYFDRYGQGMHYAVFRRSRRTRWYVFFTTYRQADEVVYLVRYITNNHVSAQLL